MAQIRVLVVDDSLLMQRVLSDLLQTDPQIAVIGTARNGEEAIAKAASLHPDVVTMDIEMPRMDGLAAVQRIMGTNPLPIIMISALAQPEAEITLKALEYGAVDFVAKPSGTISLNMDPVKEELTSKIKAAACANILRIRGKTTHLTNPGSIGNTDKVISIAASTGGPPALTQVLTSLPSSVPPILVVQHMPKIVTKLFAKGLSQKCRFQVKEAEQGDRVLPNLALVAPGGFHMVVTKERRVNLTADPPVNYVRPSADVLMSSVAEVFGRFNVGVVLTGIGSDGAYGVKLIKQRGGFTIAQDKETSVVYGMPRVALETGCVDLVAPLEQIPKEIMKACN
jgi:two-component system chemotaxis response regulator CheB